MTVDYPVLASAVDVGSAEYRENRAELERLLLELEDLVAEPVPTTPGGGADERRLLPRERIELLLDQDAPFLELSPHAGWGSEFPIGGSIVTGIGVVASRLCVILAHDHTKKGGTANPYTIRKQLRAMEIARAARLPLVTLVESGGITLPTQGQIFVPGGAIFKEITQMSAEGIPTIAVIFGNATAGGAYIAGLSDFVVMVRDRARVYLGGPPLVKMATGEDADDEELGGAEMHSRVSGLSDYLAEDERDALRIAREILATCPPTRGLDQASAVEPPCCDPDELLGLASTDLRRPLDMEAVIARLVDGSRFEEFKRLYGTNLITGFARVHGYAIGVLANRFGVLGSDESKKAAQFIQLANSLRRPLLFLQNTTGYIVGTRYEQGGIVKDGAKMINAVSNSGVPHVTVVVGGSYGAGHYGMCGRAYDPLLLFSWPGSRTAVMGSQQLVGVLSIIKQRAIERGRAFDEARHERMLADLERQIDDESRALFTSAQVYDDGIVDPRDTRTVLGIAFAVAYHALEAPSRVYGTFRM